MAKRKKKALSGEATRYISRTKAVRKLQLNLHDFNRLAIIKNLFPIEPKNRARAQKGDTTYRPLYLRDDIKFAQHDPLIWTIRKEKALYKKLRVAKHKSDFERVRLLKRQKPVYRLDQNVLERYPRFIDAVKDLADPLTIVFMISSIQVSKPIMPHHVSRCNRLRMEFLTYCIEARCLTKAFISTKGYYYEADILGNKIVWLVPHNVYYEVPPQIDMKIMKHFVEFYLTMLGFVNFRLLSKVNLRYPLKPAHIPRVEGPGKKDLDRFKDLMMSLNCELERTDAPVSEEKEDIDIHLFKESNEKTQAAYGEKMQSMLRSRLFDGLRFFIGQENNRESLTFVIRACGGEVSWPRSVFPCSTYAEEDQSITHQIVDRPDYNITYITRAYVQPQWVYDSINTAALQPVQLYLPGVTLPPHICPFIKNVDGWYVPPEEEIHRKLISATPQEKEQILNDMMKNELKKQALAHASANLEEDVEDDNSDDDDEFGLKEEEEEEKAEENCQENGATDDNGPDHDVWKDQEDSEDTTEEVENEKDDVQMETASVSDGDDDIDEDSNKHTDIEDGGNEEERKDEQEFASDVNAEVSRGRPYTTDARLAKKSVHNEHRLRCMMIPRSNKKLYNKLRFKEFKRNVRSQQLKQKREAFEKHKLGKISDAELAKAGKRKIPLDVQERISKAYKKKVREAVKFARSDANWHVK